MDLNKEEEKWKELSIKLNVISGSQNASLQTT